MEPNPQTVNYAMYLLTGSVALTAAAAYIGLRWLPKKLVDYQARIEDAQARTKAAREDTQILVNAFCSAADRALPPQEIQVGGETYRIEPANVLKNYFRAQLEQRIGLERTSELFASLDDRTQ